VFGLLVLACLAAFFVTQRLKHTPTAVQRFKMTPSFSPTPGGPLKEESISFRIAHSDAVTVTIINAKGDDVATLVRDYPVVRYKRFSLRWNGRLGAARGYSLIALTPSTTKRFAIVPANEGKVAPAGEYRVRVALRKQDRSVLSPASFTLVRG
jgi:hypothetical protein